MRSCLITSLAGSLLTMGKRVDTVASTRADHDLLFEALAIHLGFVTRSAVDEALKLVAPDDADAISVLELLSERAGLTAQRASVLELLVDDLLARHGGNLRQCLHSLTAFGKLRHDLERRLAGLESRHPTVPPVAVGRGDRADPDIRRSNGEAAPGTAASRLPIDHADADADDAGAEAEGDAKEFEWSLSAPNAVGNRFQIMHSHAHGGIGVVSVAFDSELQREVALKQIKVESADDPDSRSRFLLEAEVTGRLEHPGIVPVYGLGFDDQGRPYYAMRFVRGITLEEAIAKFHANGAGRARDPRERALELRQLLGRFMSVCHTMAYAHSRGVLHRDLKPANVLLGPYNETLIVDWGLAKVLRRGQEPSASPPAERADDPERCGPSRPGRIIPPLGQSSSTDTVAGAAFGTPAFMSPEQAEGRLDRLGPASDVYSLGAMLYTLLCGRPPFEYAWCEVTTLLARVKNGEFSPPRQVNPRVPKPLEAVCLKAMANNPDERYASAEHLAADIERWLGDEPVSAYREPRWARILRWSRRHRTLVAGAAVLLLTTVAGLSLGIILLGRAQRETEAQRQAAVREGELATLMSGDANARADSLRRRDYVSRVNLANREFLDDNAGLAEQLLYGCPSNLRNWEWSHVQRLAHLELDTFVNADTPQRQDVWSLAFSPDGRRLVSGSGPWSLPHAAATAALVVREVDSGREVFARRGWNGAVQAVAFSPDGKHVVAGTGTSDALTGAVLTCHDAATGQTLWRAEEHEINILSLAFSPDGKTVASGCGGFNNYSAIGYVRLRDAATGKVTGQVPGGPGGVASVAFSPGGDQLALANRGMVDVWDLASHSIAFQLRGHLEFVYAVAFSPDGRWIASGGWDKAIRLWDRPTGKLVRTLLGNRGFVRGLSFRPDSKQIISCSEDRGLRLWDVATGRSLASFHGHTGFVHCVAFSPDGAQAASGGMDGSIKLWPAAAPDTQVMFRNGSGWVGTVAFHPAGHRVATAHNGGIRVWDPRTGEEFWRIVGPRGLLGRIGLTFSPDGQFLIATTPNGALNLWNAETGGFVRKLAQAPSPIVDAAPSPDGSLLATAGEDGAVVIWSLATGAPARTLTGHAAAVNAVVFSADGRRLATASEDKKIKIWDAASGSELATLSGHLTGVRDVAFSPDGRFLASVGGQYRGTPVSEVMIWDAETGGFVRKLEGHTGLATAVAYFPDGRRLATASDDRTIKLWDPETGDDVFTLRGHTSGVVSLAISRDGRQVVSGSIDCTARIWSAEPAAALVDQVRRRAAVELVQSLFETYMLKSEVITALKSDHSLNESLRAAALQIAERRSEDAQGLFEAAWLTILRPTSTSELNLQALGRLEAACRLVAADPVRQTEYLHALSLALYRAGRSDEALQLVARLNTQPASGPAKVLPIDLAVSAMASQKLGRFADARDALERLRALVDEAPGAGDQEALGFLREVEGVVHE
jgi:eukaryotic-like serine/threonine-protein kinase